MPELLSVLCRQKGEADAVWLIAYRNRDKAAMAEAGRRCDELHKQIDEAIAALRAECCKESP